MNKRLAQVIRWFSKWIKGKPAPKYLHGKKDQ